RALGQLIDVRARIVDEDGAPVSGAMVEIWHCNAAGKYIHPNDSNDAPEDPNFYGAARLLADAAGRVELRTIKPGAYPVPDTDGWWRPPHIHFSVWGRVWLSRLVTQMFFPGEPLNERDPILNAVRDPQARARCIARFVPQAGNALVYEYNLVVRGRNAAAEMTLGPFFPREFAAGANDLAAGAQGEPIEITGRVVQADGRALDNVVLEIW